MIAQTVSVSDSNVCEDSSFYLFVDDFSPTIYKNQWQYSTDQVEWSDLSNDLIYSGVTNEKLNFSNIPYSLNNTYYRCLLDSTDDGEYDAITSDFQLSVFTNTIAGSIEGSQSICHNTVPNIITTTNVPSGGDGFFTYQWFDSNDGINWNQISGAVQKDYQPSSLTENTFYRIEYSGLCNSLYSNTIEIEVYEDLTSGEIIGDTICYNTTPGLLEFSNLPTGVDGNYTYQWQESDDLVTWNDIDGATSTTYQEEALTATKHYRNTISSIFGCNSVTTNVVSVTVYSEFTTGVINESAPICYNGIPDMIRTTTLPTGGDGSYTYQWYQSSDQTNWSAINGATSQDYEPSNLTSTTYYRVEYINSCKSGFSNVSEVEVFPEFTTGVINESAPICYNGIPDMIRTTTLPTGGDGSYAYQWYLSSDQTNWSAINGATSQDYEPSNLTSTTYYRVEYINSCKSGFSNVSEVEVFPEFTTGVINESAPICYNGIPDMIRTTTLPTGGDGSYTYQWYLSSDQTNWSAINGATSQDYEPSNLTSTTYYRVEYINSCKSGFSNVSEVEVFPEFTTGVINESAPICYNGIPDMISTTTLPTGGDGSYAYQWYLSSDQTNWSAINGATSKDYEPSNLTSTTYYRVEYINSCKSGFSNVSEVEVFPEIFPGKIGNDQTLCYGGISSALEMIQVPSGGGYGNYIYQWQKSEDGIIWVDIAGENTTTYSPGSLTQTTSFRLETSSVFGCGPVATNAVEIEVYEDLTSGEIIGDTICYNTTPGLLEFSNLPTGVDGNYTYQWQESDDLVTWNDIDGATSTTYQEEALTATKHYRNTISSTFGCDSVTTNVVSVTVYAEFTTGVINESAPICYNGIPDMISTTTLPTGGDGSYAYQWYLSSDQTNWSAINGATSKDYEPSNLTSTTYYRVEYINSCKSGFSNVSEVEVFPEIFPGKIGNDQTLCYGGISSALEMIQVPSGGGYGNYIYQWQKSEDGIIWVDIAGENTTTYSPGSLTQTTSFRLETSSVFGCGPVATNAVEIEVYEDLTSGEIIGDTICYNTTPGLLEFSNLPTGVDGNYTYQWQESDDLVTWNDIDGATSTTYQDEALTATKHYRNTISSTFGCDSVTTNVVSVTVYAEFTTGVINESAPICYNGIPDMISTTTLPTGGDGSYAYQWYLSSDQTNWSAINGATSKDYEPSNLTSTTYYRVEYINSCKSEFSNVSEVLVNRLPDDVTILGEEKVCANQIDVLYKVSNVNEFYSYQWQCTNGEIVVGRNTSECIINWDNTPGVIGTVSVEQTIDSTGCSKITDLPIEVSEYSAPNATSIIRKPNTNILIAKDESAGLLFQWGYDSKNSDDSVTILGANLRYVLVSPELNFNEFRYWLKTSFENEDNTSCETYTYFNPDTDGTIAAPKVEELLIYPNPANGTIYFDNLNLKNSEVKVYATNGRLINYFIDNQSTITLDKGTPPGIYLIRVSESGNVINKKIILK